MIGTKVAHYTITGTLGKGGMGVVYEASDHHLDRIVALKILPPDVTAKPGRRQRFVQEAKAASALNHPGIVTIYDIASTDGFDYIAMELVRGQTLEQVLSHGPMPFDAAMKVGGQLADAMGAAHAAGIVHRDLKPGNIMINERGDVKVLDFGLAKLTEEENGSGEQPTLVTYAATQEGTVLGTGPYMSPEQVEARKVDARSDIFSFGAVLYEMATGNCVFARSSLAATMAAVLKDNPPPPSVLVPGLPKDFDRLTSNCLTKDPLRRTQSMAEVQREIQALPHNLKGHTRSAAAPTASRFRKYPVAVAALLLLIAVAFIVRVILVKRTSVPASFHAKILTSFIGYHRNPSLSPDGNQLAFDWTGDAPDKPPHIYLSLLGKGSPLRLSPESVEACCAAWSPDGQSIAFVRQTRPASEELELVVMPALGGAERVLVTGKEIYYPTWSPDGRWLVWSQMEKVFSLWAVVAAGGDPRRIDDPGRVKTGGGDFGASISPDGRQIAFERTVADFDSDLFVADFHDGRITGSPRQLTFEHEAKGPPVWSETGQDVFYINGSVYGSQPSIRRIPAAGGQPRVIEGIGQNAVELAYSPKAHRLVYSTSYTNFDIHRLDLSDPSATPQRFLSSNRFDTSPTYSPDGKHITFDSNRGGSREIWAADADGSNATPVTSFGRGITGSGQWSPDGKYLVFDARPDADADVYIIPASGGSVRKLTDYTGEDHNAHFSPDGKWIYFASRRSGGHEIFRMHLDGSGVEQITHDGAVFPMFGKDGKWLYYSISKKGIWKMPIDGGPAVQVLDERQSSSSYTYTITAKGIYALAKKGEKKYEIVFYPFQEGKPRTLVALDRPIYMYPAVSPDERYLLYTTADDPVYEMMLVENFR